MPNESSNFTMPDTEQVGRQHSYAPMQWGRRGNEVDEQGRLVGGTSLLEKDVDRYRQLGQGGPKSGPAIDRTASDQTRGIGMGSLSLLQQTAAGAVPSAAERLGQRQTVAAQNAQVSMGASVRGGGAARAAAARSTANGVATIGQVGAQQQQATRAGEMANARDAYAGAVNGQRGQDLGLASDQAKLNMGQVSANEQRDQFYENLGFNTKKAGVDAVLGRSAADEAAANASRTQALNEQTNSRQQTNQMISAGVGGAQGLVQGYGASQASTPQKSSDPWDPSNYTGSDERMKQDVMPLDAPEGTELHISEHGKGYLASNAPDVTSGASLSGPTPRYGAKVDAPKPVAPKAAKAKAAPKKKGDDELLRMAREMLASQQSQGEAQLSSGASVGGYRSEMLSDSRAKAQAWDEGHATAIANIEKVSRMTPDEIKEREETHPEAAAVKGIKARAWDEGNKTAGKAVLAARSEEKVNATIAAMDAHKAEMQAQKAARAREDGDEQPMSPAPGYVPSAPAPSAWSQLAARARSMVSDERAKAATPDAPMAGANRSMAPSSYEYKPGFAEQAGQKQGETNVGPMAQNMAADPVASTAIVKRPDGLLAIDKDKGLKLVMGGLASVQTELDQLKKRASK